MKHLNEYLNEGLEADTKSLKDLVKAINKLPDTIEYISIPLFLKSFNNQSTKVFPKDSKYWRQDVESILKNTLKGKEGKSIDQFELKSYFGRGGRPSDSFYIKLSSKDSRGFADAMSKDGSLD
jgi:hypothetical protein